MNTIYNQTEEVFFLNFVGEVMKVWASKSGKAKLNILVENGLVDLQLGFNWAFQKILISPLLHQTPIQVIQSTRLKLREQKTEQELQPTGMLLKPDHQNLTRSHRTPINSKKELLQFHRLFKV